MLVNIGTCQVNPSYVESVINPYQSLGCMNHQLYFEVHMQSGATYEVVIKVTDDNIDAPKLTITITKQ